MYKVTVKTKINRDVEKGLKQGYIIGLKELVELTEQKAKEFAPVDTGYLRDRIFKRLKRTMGFVKVRVSYAIYQELGTIKMSAANGGKGFFRPAAQFVRTKISAVMGRDIRKGIRRS